MYIISVNLGGTVVGDFRSKEASEEHLRANGWTPPQTSSGEWTKETHCAFVLPVIRSLSEIGEGG